ncbi:hypothetical protein H7I76_09870 [Mycolicibacterium vaccae]|nr:hypothetical protein [Mycolicibacterium vaccae]
MVTFGGIPLVIRTGGPGAHWYADPQALIAGCTPGIDHQRRFGRDVVGIREYEGQLVTVISVEAAPDVASGRHRHQAAGAGHPASRCCRCNVAAVRRSA